jgi:hypothetical protein
MALEELEAKRRKTLVVAGILFSLAGVFLLVALGGHLWSFILGSILVGLAIDQIIAFKAKAKQALVAPLAESLGFRYWADRGFSREEALASGFFPSPDGYTAEDLVEGEVRGVPFASSDIALYRKVERKVNGKREQHYQVLFWGVLYRFRLPFTVEKEVRFGPPGTGKGAYTGKRLERVVLESPEFKRFFEVYGEDQVGARRLLTPRVQEALVSLRRRLGKPIRGAVREKDLWLAVEGRDRFPKPPILRPVAQTFEDWKSRYLEDLSEASRVVEALKVEEEARRRGVFLGGEGGSPLG